MIGESSSIFRCANGFRDGRWTQLFPGVDLLSVPQMVDTWQMMLRVAPAPPGYPGYSEYPAYGFIREFVPIADRDGYLWVVDTRPGARFGQVIAFDKISADEDATSWPSLGYLLRELTDAIQGGSTFDGWSPSIVEGRLTWARG